MNITDNFTWEEVQTTNHDIDNTIPVSLKDNATRQAQLLEECRVYIGPLKVNSWYRSKAVNNAVGGEQTSYHLDALATDVVPKGNVLNAFKMLIASDIDYDKIIYEKRKSEWIHVQSPQPGRAPRKQALVATYSTDGWAYEPFNG